MAHEEQPRPTPGRLSVTRKVMADLAQREVLGIERYGRSLETFNGRDALRDAYEESIDQSQHLCQAVEERQELYRRICEIDAEFGEAHFGVARALLDDLMRLLGLRDG